MRDDGRPAGCAIHATAVAVGERGLLITGASRAGKSRLAAALIACSTPTLPIVLVADDRVLLRASLAGLVARPHPRIAGFIERRGLGLVAMPFREAVVIGGLVRLGPATTTFPDRENFPVLCVVHHDAGRDLATSVLTWFAAVANRDTGDTPARKAAVADWLLAKD